MKRCAYLMMYALFVACLPTVEGFADDEDSSNPLSETLLEEALKGQKKYRKKLRNKRYVTVIDYDLPYTEKRLWVVDTKDENRVVYHTHVSHAYKSGDLYATKFSNRRGSNLSSLGFYVTEYRDFEHSYLGHSLRIHGLETRNSNAYKRGIIFHQSFNWSHSLGCFMIADNEIGNVLELIKGHSLLYVHYTNNKKS